MYGSMKSVTSYFGEDWDANDPSRVLRVIRDFMNLFNKAQHEIEVCPLLTPNLWCLFNEVALIPKDHPSHVMAYEYSITVVISQKYH